MTRLSTLSTLWKYINRTMPWNAPKLLSTDEVYASTRYILHLGNVHPANFVLGDTNIREVQARLSNRGGMTNCALQTAELSRLPEHARDAYGNLAEHSRTVSPSREQRRS